MSVLLRKSQRRLSRDEGYTLVELLMTIAIISVLGGMAAGVSASFVNRSKADGAVQSFMTVLSNMDKFAYLGGFSGSSGGRAWRRTVISAVTMPVGTASVPQPTSIMAEAMKRPSSVLGVMSPKPTVVMAVIAQ